MNIAQLLKVSPFLFSAFWIGAAQGQAIYPIDKAEILAGSKFDIKVEL